MSPDRLHLCMSPGRSLLLTATLEAVAAGVPIPPTEPHPASNNNTATAVRGTRMRPTLRERLAPPPPLWQHAGGLDLPNDLQAATSEYVGWLQLGANRRPNTGRANPSELNRLRSFLAAHRHALALDGNDCPRTGKRLIVTGKGSKQRAVYLTADARAALEEYLAAREDACMALFINFDRSAQDDRGRRLTGAGARFIVRRLRKELGAWSFKSPHVARHTTATTLLEVTGGDVRLVQEVLGHANLNTLQGYTN